MDESRDELDELLSQLASDGAIDQQQSEAARSFLDAQGSRRTGPFGSTASGVPWFVQPLLLLGALLAAALLTVGFAVGLSIRWDAGPLFAAGALYLGGGVVLHRASISDFFEYLALSLSLGGHAFVLIGVAELAGGSEEMWMFAASAMLCAALYFLHQSPLHRFGSCLLVFVLAKFAFPAEDLGALLHAVVAAACAGSAFLLTRPVERPALRPLAYACVAGLILLVLPLSERGLWFADDELPNRWIASATAAVALLWAAKWAADRHRRGAGSAAPVSMAGRTVAILTAGGLAALGTPGIPVALFLAVLGHATHHAPVALVALVSLPVFVFKFYYELEIDLLAKSWMLAGSGVLLLLARWWFVAACSRKGRG